jgi:hypothetical protein
MSSSTVRCTKRPSGDDCGRDLNQNETDPVASWQMDKESKGLGSTASLGSFESNQAKLQRPGTNGKGAGALAIEY